MKIRRLQFENIHALKGVHEINFDESPLSDTGIFVITGPTGSGKSTILDAISLALYNQIPRVSKISRNDIEQTGSIITNNTSSAFAEVEYEINGKAYRSKWSIHVSGRSHRLQDYNMELASLPDGEFLVAKKSDVPKMNAEIIGLTYDQFVKSILLSQGEFSKFLKSSKDERSALFEKITGTEIYRRLGTAAFKRQRIEKEKLDMLANRLDIVQLMEKEEVAQKQEELKQLEQKSVGLRELLAKLQKLESIKVQKEATVKKISQMQEQIQSLKQEQEKHQAKFQKLEQHEQLSDYQQNLFQLDELRNKEVELKNKLEKLAESLKQEKEKLENSRKQEQEQLLEVGKQQEQIKQMEPVLKKVRELDAELHNEQKNAKQLQKQQDELQVEHMRLTDDQAKIDELQKKNKRLLSCAQSWLATNKIAEGLQQDLPLIHDKVQRYNQYKVMFDTALQAAVLLKADLENLPQVNFEKQQFLASLHQQKKQKQGGFVRQCSYKLEERNLLNEQRLQLREDFQSCRTIVDKLKNNAEIQQQLTELTSKQKQATAQLAEAQKEEQSLKNEKEIQEKKQEELSVRFERIKLESKYKGDRKKLRPDEPCFLCGSLQHPYVKEYVDLQDETQKELNKLAGDLKKLDTLILQNSKTVSALATELKSLQAQEKEKATLIKKTDAEISEIVQQKDWELSRVDVESFEQMMQQIAEKGKKLSNEINLLEEVEKLEKELLLLASLMEKLDELVKQRTDLEDVLKKYKTLVHGSEKLEAVLNVLAKLNDDFRKYQLQEQDLQVRIEKNKLLTKEKEQQISDLKLKLEKQQVDLQQLKQELKQKIEERKEILGTKQPDEVQKQMQQKLDSLSAKRSDLQSQISACESTMKQLGSQQLQLTKEQEKVQVQFRELSLSILPALQKLGYQTYEDALKALLPADERKQIIQLQKELHDQLLNAKQSDTDLKKSLIDLEQQDEQPAKSLQQLKEELETTRKDQEAQNKQMGILSELLRSNAEQQKLQKQLLGEKQKQQKEFWRWDELNSLIGDSKGNKFSKLAQELTLLQLIALANKHLAKLNPRYLISEKEAEIYVVDTYLANMERNVQTLSGGETFLVSLALALGLSDLAGNKTCIECLFIDEGFGTLDQEMLDQALDTLEKLQLETSRTIGLISHVQALKERIPTQIELIRTGNGHSRIEMNA